MLRGMPERAAVASRRTAERRVFMEPGPMREVTLLVVALALGVAPFAALIALLNLRDRRCAGLLARTSAAFSGEALRSDVAVRVECRLFTPRSVVTVDMRVWSRDAVWDAVTRLRRVLPASARLRIDGTLDPALRTRLIVERVEPARRLGLRAA
jgi:hypothetical protein